MYRVIVRLYDQCQRQVVQLPQRRPLFSFSRENFHPPANVSGIVDVIDLEVAILLVDLLTIKHENNELRWQNQHLQHENQVFRSKVDLYELTNKYFQTDVEFLSNDEHNQELKHREKKLRLYVFRLYELLQMTTSQTEERKTYYETLLYQFKKRHQQLTEQCRQIREQLKNTV